MLNKVTLILCALSFLGAIAGTVGANRGFLPASAGMYLLALSSLVGMLAAACAMTVLFTTKNYPVAMIGLLSLLPFFTVAALAIQASKFPLINDISTNLEDVPAFVKALELPENAGRDMAYPEDFKTVVKEHYQGLTALTLDGDPAAVFTKVRAYAEKHILHAELTRIDPEKLEIEGVVSTRVFRWKDDFILRVRPAEPGKCIVDMRSKSRDGKGDLGANARRIENFFEALRSAP
ncbi:MAG: DUF1499 domain-containing protein [Candidatus Hydrogenedentes bacterium]|nr:DUF1499 domain-containing protein [Candidatus Hydrogenedentota bacterium]